MSWVISALIAIGFMGVSDVFRKLSSTFKDPLFANLVFQLGSFVTAIVLFFAYSRKIENKPESIVYALIGGMLISTFTLFSYKALSAGPGVSTVMPVLRIGGVTLVAILGIVVLREQVTAYKILGMLFSAIGIYLLFSTS